MDVAVRAVVCQRLVVLEGGDDCAVETLRHAGAIEAGRSAHDGQERAQVFLEALELGEFALPEEASVQGLSLDVCNGLCKALGLGAFKLELSFEFLDPSLEPGTLCADRRGDFFGYDGLSGLFFLLTTAGLAPYVAPAVLEFLHALGVAFAGGGGTDKRFLPPGDVPAGCRLCHI